MHGEDFGAHCGWVGWKKVKRWNIEILEAEKELPRHRLISQDYLKCNWAYCYVIRVRMIDGRRKMPFEPSHDIHFTNISEESEIHWNKKI